MDSAAAGGQAPVDHSGNFEPWMVVQRPKRDFCSSYNKKGKSYSNEGHDNSSDSRNINNKEGSRFFVLQENDDHFLRKDMEANVEKTGESNKRPTIALSQKI